MIKRSPHRPAAPRARLAVERLEARLVPYALSGNAWPHPERVTISFVPDGAVLGTNGGVAIHSNLFAALNARFGSPGVWQSIFLRAAQGWAQQTNLNFDLIPDNGAPAGAGN